MPTSRGSEEDGIEYGEAREGHWTAGLCVIWRRQWRLLKQRGTVEDCLAFDHSSCHGAMPEDALDASKMNVNPGGRQWVMWNGWWGGKPQKRNTPRGIPKGMQIVLEEQGINTWKMNAEEMCDVLNSHPDFKNKFMIEHFFFEEKNILFTCYPSLIVSWTP